MLDLSLPAVAQFKGAAGQHRRGARVLYEAADEKSPSAEATEAVYLGGYVVECVLKALILSRTPKKKHPETLKRLKEKIGHNLEEARRLLQRELNVVFPTALKLGLRVICSMWDTEMRYEPKSTRKKMARDFLRSAESIWSWVTQEQADAIG